MRLLELSVQYRAAEEALRQRMELLEGYYARETDQRARRMLEERLRRLGTMWREARDLAVLCERYYDRGYCRSVRYTV